MHIKKFVGVLISFALVFSFLIQVSAQEILNNASTNFQRFDELYATGKIQEAVQIDEYLYQVSSDSGEIYYVVLAPEDKAENISRFYQNSRLHIANIINITYTFYPSYVSFKIVNIGIDTVDYLGGVAQLVDYTSTIAGEGYFDWYNIGAFSSNYFNLNCQEVPHL